MADILVVDDEIGIRELLAEILGDEGYVVSLAENAQEARQMRNSQDFDLILLDIWMPDTDGLTLLREWAKGGKLSLPVIMMSGHATADTAIEAKRVGAADFLEKPITLQKLLQSIANALSNFRRRAFLPLPASGGPSKAGAIDGADVGNAAPKGAAKEAASPAPGFVQVASQELPLDVPLREARDAFERIYFEHHLSQEHGSMTRVAEKSGLERTHLYRKLKQLGIGTLRSTYRSRQNS